MAVRFAGMDGETFIGRARELAIVHRFWDVGDSRGAAALVLSGSAGIGKTTLVRAAVTRAEALGLRVLIGQPTATEQDLPCAAFGDLFGGVCEEVRDRLPLRQRQAIEAAHSGAGVGVASDGTALARGVLEMLRLTGADGRLALVIDDVQWLDRPTESALSFALRRLGSTPVRVLVAERIDDGASAAVPLGLAEWPQLHRLTLTGMSATELGAVVRERLGLQLSRPRLVSLAAECGGNPMFAIERARDPSGAAPALSTAVARRVQDLNPGALEAVETASATQRPTTDVLLRAGVERSQLRLALASGVLEVSGDRVRFTHPLLAEAAYGLLLPDERREIHRRLAAAVDDVVERGYHTARSATRPDEAAAAVLDEAARQAARRGDHAGAAGFALRAAELSTDPDSEVAMQRRLHAATEFRYAGDLDATATCARHLIDRLPHGGARARARELLVWSEVGSGLSYEDELAAYAAALDDAAAEPAVTARLYYEMSGASLGMCRLDQGLRFARQSMAAAERAGDSAAAVDALAMVGFAESMLGLGVTLSARQAFERWDGVTRWALSPRLQLACALTAACEFHEAEELFEQEIRAGRAAGVEMIEVLARAHLAEVLVRAGRWAESLDMAQDAVEHARQAANGQVVTGTLSPLAMTYALIGEHRRARELAGNGLEAAEATDDFWFRISHRAILGLVALAQGESQQAVDVLGPAWTLMLERGLGDLSLFPVGHVLGEALVGVGRLDDAAHVVETLRTSPVGALPWSRAMAARCAALIASARGSHDRARAEIALALAAHDDLPEPFEQARTLHIAGRIERAARRWGAARVVLGQALDRFDALGAAAWTERVGADLARLPGRRRNDDQTLTLRERDVAELAANGMTNKQIAARLFISVATVEANLSKVYAKLQLRSRVELAARLDRPQR